jgi:hypothetical protein
MVRFFEAVSTEWRARAGKEDVSRFMVKELRCLEGIPLCISDSIR